MFQRTPLAVWNNRYYNGLSWKAFAPISVTHRVVSNNTPRKRHLGFGGCASPMKCPATGDSRIPKSWRKMPSSLQKRHISFVASAARRLHEVKSGSARRARIDIPLPTPTGSFLRSAASEIAWAVVMPVRLQMNSPGLPVIAGGFVSVLTA